jgi:hypothetical protein
VRLRAQGNVNLASALAAGEFIDGVELVEGDLVLCDRQTDGLEDGVYVVPASGAESRDSVWAVGEAAGSWIVFAEEGDADKDNAFACINDSGLDVIGTDALVFTRLADMGPQGPTGAQGPTGVGGATGPQGEKGIDGSTGPQGYAGATGPVGYIGSTGPVGYIGATGPDGEQGIQGLTGSTGPVGEQGPTGLTGATGPQGEVGYEGATGPTGLVGSTGPIGADGKDLSSLVNGHGSNIVICEPVYEMSNGQVDLARANAEATTRVLGLVYDTAIADTEAGNIIVDGFLTASTAQWDAVTGQTGGLTPGALYYLSVATAGKLTSDGPDTVGDFVARVGRAVSVTRMEVAIMPRVKL